MEWVSLRKSFTTEAKADDAANIVATTEARLANQARGPQYQVETRVEQIDGQWQVFWRKVLIGYSSGCGSGCGSCHESPPQTTKKGKVIPFKQPAK